MNNDEMWAAFQAKDATCDGKFYAAVRTTGVYCRPSCAARPQRKNVEFFASADAAEAAGYRPCKRCQPRAERAPAAALAQRVADFIEEHGHARLDTLSRALGYSPAYLQRAFTRVVGASPAQYARARRGSSERRGAIRCTVVDSPLGRMLAARTQRGLCAVYFGEDDDALLRELRRVHPRAHVERDDDCASTSPAARSTAPCARCRSTCRAPLFRRRYGRRCAKFPTARRAHIETSPKSSADQPQCAPSPTHAAPTNSPWSSPATAPCAATAPAAAIDGGRGGSGSCWQKAGRR